MNKKFLIKNLFNIINNPQLDKKNFIFSERAKYPYFTRTENNNGIYGYVKYFDDDHLIPGNSLAVGMISMQFHYMQHDFYAGQFTKTLIPKFRGFNENLAMYFIAILNKHSGYYQSYLVRHFKEKISETVVELPVIEHADPNHEYTVDDIDWQYMEDRIKELEKDRIKELEAYLKVANLDDYELTDEDKKVLSLSRKSASNENGSLETDCENGALRFKKFVVGDLFSSSTGDVDLQQKDINGKGVFLINSGVDNRGIKGRTDRKAKIFPANTITIDFWGNAYYRDFEYKMATHNHVFSLTGKIIKNRLVGLYLIGRLAKLPTLFSYNNMATWNKLRVLTVTLPVTPDGEPDFDYMERYIRAIEKLTIANVVKYKDKIIDTTKMLVNAV